MIQPRLLFLFSILFSFNAYSQPQANWSGADIKQGLKKLNTLGSVLYIAAHPDDENTRLLSYFAKERNLRTAYLSVTRGDGGQNLIGNEQAELLGLIRTQELLAARRVDGAQQFFTRANDFGFSKNPEETLKLWGKEEILSDMVWVIRNFRPDVIITRFPTNGDGGHGHHTASAILAQEAFAAAADSTRFPEQLKYVSTWQVKRLFWNRWIPQETPDLDLSKYATVDVGAYNELLGQSYSEIAADSRSMHKSQGFGSAKLRGSRKEYFERILGDTVIIDPLEGIDLSWKKTGTPKIEAMIKSAINKFNMEQPAASLPALLKIYTEATKTKDSLWKQIKLKELEGLILACSGLWMEAVAADYSTTPGSELKITASILNRSNVAVVLKKISFPDATKDTITNQLLGNNTLLNIEKQNKISEQTEFTNPYWLKEKHSLGLYTVNEQQLIGTPENRSNINVIFSVEISGQSFEFKRPVTYKWTDPVDGELYRNIEILPEVTIGFESDLILFTDTQPKNINLIVKSSRENVSGSVMLKLPAGWKSEPEKIIFNHTTKNEETNWAVKIIPPVELPQNKKEIITAMIEIDGVSQNARVLERINYKHIPIQTFLEVAEVKLLCIDLKRKSTQIGYIEGAGDEVADCLKQVGYEVTLLDEKKLNEEDLDRFDAIIVGIRAYNTLERLKFHQNELFEYVNNGGNLIVQYNTNGKLLADQIGPYPFKIGRDRVTVEEAPVKFLNIEHPLLVTPNKITTHDFDGWVQERGLYFLSEWDKNYEPLFSINDPGENELLGSLIVAKYGKGLFVYTGLSFFRQLPAGVPGAYRLFTNMIEYGN